MSHNVRPSRYAVSQSKARIFVGQLEPYVTEQDLYPVFSCYGKILHLNIVRHSTTVTPNEERRIPTAFVWYETTTEADAAIAALHNVFTFSSPDEEENKVRYIQVSYADKSPECTPWGRWQKTQAEIMRRTNPSGTGTGSNNMPGQYTHVTSGSTSAYSSPALNTGGGYTVSASGPAIRSSQSSGDIVSMRYPRNPSRGPLPLTSHIDHTEAQYYSSYDNLYSLGHRSQLYSVGSPVNNMMGYAKHTGMPPDRSISSGDLTRGSTSSIWNVTGEMKSPLADPSRFRHTARYTVPEPDEDLIMAAPSFTVTSGP
ncbi:hypothetical protein, unknown function [Leishmania braziliensis MHOM/BR/75/M2904]|uniref:RRM domain-containing protein n=2 Tax=Leishmania braziliensis TaxID=5660 RepID=A4HJR5_LEIBR|nr:hypothetical protein, unknown function [Leishmania braziliensis MHOM/BR/75/M2904]KAI5688016.1 RNA recognition motif [Leishmania braziliensis]CAJ2478097.1 unnamed protein product [Leishmania braziliensis]CAJ2478552.1 unnamed protein product [Leishmania braziliensis]CAM42732.1 hypothetical protein, unknown function [Leishmania braziliensis MHOM/BR/75/M2904]SYZ68459.1 RNA_recognition_motif._(a.k.a._RRM [Leishmania braziliensis MHOM/BR/75/M2904]